MQSALGNASPPLRRRRTDWQTVLAGAHAGQEVADLAVHQLGLLRLRGRRVRQAASHAAGLVHRTGDVGDVVGDLARAAGRLLHTAGDLLDRSALLFDAESMVAATSSMRMGARDDDLDARIVCERHQIRATQCRRCRASCRHANGCDVTPDWQSIETPRLILRTLPQPALQALTAGDRVEASRLSHCDLSTFPDDQLSIANIRLKDLEADPDYLPWSLRAMALKPGLRFVGHFNFHSKPNADYLRELAPGAVEMGYYMLPEFRRQGLAEEAVLGMMDWAGRTHGIGRFVVSISPENGPSVAMARKLGFARIGSHIDEEDGYEDILARDAPL